MGRRDRSGGGSGAILFALGLLLVSIAFLAVVLSDGSGAGPGSIVVTRRSAQVGTGVSVSVPLVSPTTTTGSATATAPSTGTGPAPTGTVTPVTTAPEAGAGTGDSEITVGAPLAVPAVGADFLGLSIEYQELLLDTGTRPGAPNPVFLQLIRDLHPQGSPLLRIGGDSTDWSWLPVSGLHRVKGEKVRLTPTRLAMLGALGRALDARFLLGINLEADSPVLAAAEAGALLGSVGREHVAGFELGNEPELYDVLGWYANRHHRPVLGRRRPYTLADFTTDFNRIAAALPASVPLAGPTVGVPRWLGTGRGLEGFLRRAARLATVTVHAYPLKVCGARPGSARYPTIARLLSDASTQGVVRGVTAIRSAAHAAGRPIRVDEINSISCKGVHGVSDTFASALWTLETLLDLARAGIDGVNMATLPNSAYSFWRFGPGGATVHPDYYGMLDFARSVPAGSRFLQVSEPGADLALYALRTPAGGVRVIAVNAGPARVLRLRIPGAAGTGRVLLLRAASLAATDGVTLGGRGFGPITATGRLTGRRRRLDVAPVHGRYTLSIPAASAATLSIP